MKNRIALTAAIALTLGTACAFADDVRVDEAQALVTDGTIQPFEKLNDKALAVRAGTITDTELEKEYGKYVYKVDIRDANGVKWDLDIDAVSAEVLKNQMDD